MVVKRLFGEEHARTRYSPVRQHVTRWRRTRYIYSHSWQVHANIFKVMRNSFLRDFYFLL